MKKVFILFLILLICSVFACLPTDKVLAAGTIEINTASPQQLEEITGIGPALAQRIVDDRPFSSIDDLLRVKGIGEKTLQKIKAQGLAYVAGQIQQPAQEINPTPTPATPPAPTPLITYPSGIFINEILPAPEGADETNEWVELYNSNNFDVDLSDWKLQDIKGTPATYVFSKNTMLLSNGYLILKRPETKITLNNDEDGLNLILPNEKIIDSISFAKALKNQSYNKKASGWQWSATLTPSAVNIIADLPIQTKTLPKNQKTDITYLSALSESINPNTNSTSDNLNTQNKSNPWFLFLTALAITVISSIIILILKLKFKKRDI